MGGKCLLRNGDPTHRFGIGEQQKATIDLHAARDMKLHAHATDPAQRLEICNGTALNFRKERAKMDQAHRRGTKRHRGMRHVYKEAKKKRAHQAPILQDHTHDNEFVHI